MKYENSPKTPPLSLQSQTFLTASQSDRSPPRSMPPHHDHLQQQPPSTVINIDHLPPYQDYNFTINYSATTTPIRQQFEDRDQTFDPSIFNQVSQVRTFNPMSRNQWLTVGRESWMRDHGLCRGFRGRKLDCGGHHREISRGGRIDMTKHERTNDL